MCNELNWTELNTWPSNHTKLMQNLRVNGTDWHKIRLISKLYMDQSVKLRLDQGETRNLKSGRRVRQGCCLSQNKTCTANNLPSKPPKGLETSKYEDKYFAKWNVTITLCYCLRKKWCYMAWLMAKWNWMMLWNGNKCGKNENIEATVCNTDYGSSKTKGKCGIFQIFSVAWYQMMLDIHVKLNPGLPWYKQHSTRRRLFSPANCT